MPRDRWAGGIVTDADGAEVGQVAYGGTVYESRPGSAGGYVAAYEPSGAWTDWKVPSVSDREFVIDIPTHGPVALGIRTDQGPPFVFSLLSRDGFRLDGRRASLDASLTIGAGGIVLDEGYSEVALLDADGTEEGFEGVDEYLAETLVCAVREWVSDGDNAQALTEMVSNHTLAEAEEHLNGLGDGDQAFEESRREVLAAALSYAAYVEAVEQAMAFVPRP